MGDNTLAIPKANPHLEATGSYQFLNQPMLSQYLESDYSVFGSPMYNMPLGTTPSITGTMGMPMMGMGMGMPMMGMWGNGQYMDQYIDNMKKYNNGMYDILDNSSNRRTDSERNTRANNYILNTNNSIIRNLVKSMKDSISSNEMRSACSTYDRLFETWKNEYGHKFEDGEKINMEESFKAAIADAYEEVNQTSLKADINEHGSGAFGSGWDEAWGDGQNSAKQALSYMTNDTKQYSPWEKFCKGAGHFFGDLLFGFCADDGKADIKRTTTY